MMISGVDDRLVNGSSDHRRRGGHNRLGERSSWLRSVTSGTLLLARTISDRLLGAVEDRAGSVRDCALIIQLCAGCDGQERYANRA